MRMKTHRTLLVLSALVLSACGGNELAEGEEEGGVDGGHWIIISSRWYLGLVMEGALLADLSFRSPSINMEARASSEPG